MNVPHRLAMQLALPLLCVLPAVSAFAAEYRPGSPATYLFDTGTAAPEPLAGAGVAAKTGWTLVPEDDLTRPFRGDAVLLNDRLAVVLRRRGTGVEVYGLASAEPRLRVVLVPLAGSGGEPAAPATARILENNPGAVMLAAAWRTDGGRTAALEVRLTAGQMILETRPGEGTARLAVRGALRHVIVPDFFADDMVFRAAQSSRPRVRLPAENFLLGLLDGGNAQVMCVWQSGGHAATQVASTADGRPSVAGWEVEAAAGKPIWVAVLEGEGLWHERPIRADEAVGDVALDWRPPFAAKWRADLVGAAPAARCWFFHVPGETGEENAWRPEELPTCCFEGGRAVVRLERSGVKLPAEGTAPAVLLVYALDRSRATPLTTFCPTDVLRNTLGVGPCQYVLESEGLASDANPTPEHVMAFVERQFARKREVKAADEIGQMLDLMVEQVGRGQGRIAEYGRAGREVRELCAAATGAGEADAETLLRIAIGLERAAGTAENAAPRQRAAELAAAIKALIGQPDAASRCEDAGAEVRRLGGEQARTLARCRMTARWLRQSAAQIVEDRTPAAELANGVLVRVEGVLGTR